MTEPQKLLFDERMAKTGRIRVSRDYNTISINLGDKEVEYAKIPSQWVLNVRVRIWCKGKVLLERKFAVTDQIREFWDALQDENSEQIMTRKKGRMEQALIDIEHRMADSTGG
jgi:hypothetical protein